MDSFYGGRPGASFIIVKTFSGHDESGTHISGYDEMVNSFSEGNGYKEVYFDEYVTIYDIVNTTHNGEVYRRGYNLSNEGGAELVGKITGPAGQNTIIDLLPYQSINSTTAAGQPIYSNKQSEATSSEYWTGTENTIELIPGAIQNQNNNIFNDNIVYKYYNVIDEENNVNKMKIGFQIPYPVFNFKVQQTNADQQISIQKNPDTDNHKFYQDWTIFIPRSYKGNSITKLTLLQMNGTDGMNINYDFYNQNTIFEGYNNSLTPQQNKKNYDIQHNTVIIACEITSYNANGTPNPQLYYVADYEFISNIDINEQGYLTFWLPDGTEINSSVSILPTIESINMNDYGEISVGWKNTNNTEGNSTFENEVKWIKNIDYDSKGLKITWNTKAKKENNEIEYETDGVTPKRETSIIEFGEKQRVVTDIALLGNRVDRPNIKDLYFTYVGIDNDAKNGTDPYALDSIYYSNQGVWYKKVVGLETMLNTLIDERLKSLNIIIPEDDSEIIAPKDLIIDSKLYLYYPEDLSNYTTMRLNIPLSKKLAQALSNMPVQLQNEQRMRKNIRNSYIYDKSIFNRIYLSKIDSDILRQIYPNEQSDEARLTKWQNIAPLDKYVIFSSNNVDYAFIRGYGGFIGTGSNNTNAIFNNDTGYSNYNTIAQYPSQTIHKILTNHYGIYTNQEVFGTATPHNALAGSTSNNDYLDCKHHIIEYLLSALTGSNFNVKQIDTDPDNKIYYGVPNETAIDTNDASCRLISAASEWTVNNSGNGYLSCAKSYFSCHAGISGPLAANWRQLKGQTFVFNVTVELNQENLFAITSSTATS